MVFDNQKSLRFFGHTFVAVSEDVVKVIPDAHFMHDTFFYRGISLLDVEFHHDHFPTEELFWRMLRPWEVSPTHRAYFLDELVELAALC